MIPDFGQMGQRYDLVSGYQTEIAKGDKLSCKNSENKIV
jgi:hypothetical protein